MSNDISIIVGFLGGVILLMALLYYLVRTSKKHRRRHKSSRGAAPPGPGPVGFWEFFGGSFYRFVWRKAGKRKGRR